MIGPVAAGTGPTGSTYRRMRLRPAPPGGQCRPVAALGHQAWKPDMIWWRTPRSGSTAVPTAVGAVFRTPMPPARCGACQLGAPGRIGCWIKVVSKVPSAISRASRASWW
jgi:hypothetical protein